MQVNTYAEAGEQEPFDLTGDTTGIIDISWYGFWSNEVYRHSFQQHAVTILLETLLMRKRNSVHVVAERLIIVM